MNRIDATYCRILIPLQEDATLPVNEVADKVGLSTTALPLHYA